MAETPIVSDSLQKTFRDNFPSQISSGRDLHVSDTIIPVVDFSTVAGTTGLDETLQSAFAFDNATVFDIAVSSSTVIVNTPGFWRINPVFFVTGNNSADEKVEMTFSDGSTTKLLFRSIILTGYGNEILQTTLDKTYFLRAGDSITITTGGRAVASGSLRQIADISGTLVNPVGYTGS